MKIVILGGGISGLSAAWHAQKKYPSAKITLLEKTNRLGGVIQTSKEAGFLFERGPRTFQLGKCPDLLEIIRAVGLEDQLIFSDKSASTRYLWERGQLRSIGSFLPGLFFSLCKEAWVSKSLKEDESIYDFAARRFSPKIAETLFDPMTLGIYGGDIRELSIKSCFPRFFDWEKEKGSCFRGMLPSFFKKSNTPKGLFSLKNGMGSLIEALAKKLNVEIALQSEVEAIEKTGVFAGGKTFDADLVLSALSGPLIASLTDLSFNLAQRSLWVFNFCYSGNVLPKKGFGYLVPTKEKEILLGMIWDSSIFPNQNGPNKTCITAMMREGNIDSLKEAIFRHLSIDAEPAHVSSYLASNAIPQFDVGYFKRLDRFKAEVQKKFPNLRLLGNYLQSPSVESCISIAKNI